jgi:hypothetical protein
MLGGLCQLVGGYQRTSLLIAQCLRAEMLQPGASGRAGPMPIHREEQGHLALEGSYLVPKFWVE